MTEPAVGHRRRAAAASPSPGAQLRRSAFQPIAQRPVLRSPSTRCRRRQRGRWSGTSCRHARVFGDAREAVRGTDEEILVTEHEHREPFATLGVRQACFAAVIADRSPEWAFAQRSSDAARGRTARRRPFAIAGPAPHAWSDTAGRRRLSRAPTRPPCPGAVHPARAGAIDTVRAARRADDVAGSAGAWRSLRPTVGVAGWRG
jgi:hypothetical protein